MALKRTRVLGWTEDMSRAQVRIRNFNKAGQFDQANALHSVVQTAHKSSVKQIMRHRASGRGS